MIAVSRWLRIAAAAGGGLVLTWVTAGPAPALSRHAGSAASGELVYVASAGSGPVAAYAASSSGGVTPARTVDNPNTAGYSRLRARITRASR